MKFSFLKPLKITIPILLGAFLIWYALQSVPLSTIIKYWNNANKNWIILGMLLGFLSHLSRAYRWLFMLEPLGFKVKLSNSIMAVFSTYLINYTIPRAGEVARASILNTYEGVPFEKGFGTIVAERVADLLIMLLIIVITLFLEFDFIFQFFTERFNPLKIGVILGVGVVLFGLLVFCVKQSQLSLAIKTKNFIKGLIEGVLSIFKMEKKWAFLFHTLFIWGMYIAMFYATCLAIPELKNISFSAILIGFISASFSIAATNGGIGSYPVAIFAAFSIFGISKDPSYAFGWIMWASQTAMIILFGGLSLICLPLLNKKK